LIAVHRDQSRSRPASSDLPGGQQRSVKRNRLAKLLPVLDGAMLDLKAWGNEHHRFLTGRENPQIKQSIRWLADRHRLTELRLLVIPEQCDYLEHLKPLTTFIHGLGNVPVRSTRFMRRAFTVRRRHGAAPRRRTLNRWRRRWKNRR
jgi:pyruvate-formate lyase-activating enzyme